MGVSAWGTSSGQGFPKCQVSGQQMLSLFSQVVPCALLLSITLNIHSGARFF